MGFKDGNTLKGKRKPKQLLFLEGKAENMSKIVIEFVHLQKLLSNFCIIAGCFAILPMPQF